MPPTNPFPGKEPFESMIKPRGASTCTPDGFLFMHDVGSLTAVDVEHSERLGILNRAIVNGNDIIFTRLRLDDRPCTYRGTLKQGFPTPDKETIIGTYSILIITALGDQIVPLAEEGDWTATRPPT